jgi:tRNA A37 N6-isopentenylltransferase MiaA
MFANGLPDEVRRLADAGYTPRDPGLRAIGYREFFVEEEPGTYRLSHDFTGIEALVAQNSRRYAKRQVTFFASLFRDSQELRILPRSNTEKEEKNITPPCSSVSSVVYYSLEANDDDEGTAKRLKEKLEGFWQHDRH